MVRILKGHVIDTFYYLNTVGGLGWRAYGYGYLEGSGYASGDEFYKVIITQKISI